MTAAPAAATPRESPYKFVGGAIGWFLRGIFGYGSALLFTAFIIWALKLNPDSDTTDAAFNMRWSVGQSMYLFCQGVLILTVTGGRNIGRDFIAVLDLLLSLVPGAALGIIIYGNIDDAVRHPLSEQDMQIIWMSWPTILFDVMILGWLGQRIGRLIGEMYVAGSAAR